MTQDWSLGEVQSLVAKAARGAGRSFGIADEAGYAARRLSERGFDGAGALAALLEATDGADPSSLAPDPVTLRSQGDVICPLILGTYLADVGVLPGKSVGPVLAPFVLLPFAAQLSAMIGPLCLECGPAAVFQVEGAAVFGDAIEVPQFAQVRLFSVTSVSGQARARRTRASVTPQAQSVLERLAHRTYAPATEESRTKGAGAGLADND